jgi:hypothetical protein
MTNSFNNFICLTQAILKVFYQLKKNSPTMFFWFLYVLFKNNFTSFPRMGAGGNLLHYHVDTHLANET